MIWTINLDLHSFIINLNKCKIFELAILKFPWLYMDAINHSGLYSFRRLTRTLSFFGISFSRSATSTTSFSLPSMLIVPEVAFVPDDSFNKAGLLTRFRQVRQIFLRFFFWSEKNFLNTCSGESLFWTLLHQSLVFEACSRTFLIFDCRWLQKTNDI